MTHFEVALGRRPRSRVHWLTRFIHKTDAHGRAGGGSLCSQVTNKNRVEAIAILQNDDICLVVIPDDLSARNKPSDPDSQINMKAGLFSLPYSIYSK